VFPPRPRLVANWTDAKGEVRLSWGGDDEKTTVTAYSLQFATIQSPVVARGPAVDLQLTPPRSVRATASLRASGVVLPNVLIAIPPAAPADGATPAPAASKDDDRGPLVVGRTDATGLCVLRDLDPKVEKLQVVGEMKSRGRVQLERAEEPGK
jgi:hypothetical protein